MQRLATELFLLPFRTFFAGMGAMVDSLRAIQQLAENSLGTEAQVARAPAIPPRSEGLESAQSGADANLQPVTEGVIPHGAEKQPTEEVRDMSGYCCNQCGQSNCCCDEPGPCNPVTLDQDLSGDCCVKVVQYTIVSTVQGVQDNERICVEPTTIAFSDSMTTDGFVSWVIAKHCDELKGCDPKYLRVAFMVFGRFDVAGIDLQEAQVAFLGSIAHSLKNDDDDKGKR